MKLKPWALLIVTFLVGPLAGCGGGDGTSSPGTTGTLSLQMTDAATPDYQAVYITVDEVQVHTSGGGWQTVATPGQTYNLLELVNGVTEPLGNATLAAGDYTQMRLLIGDTPDEGQNLLQGDHPHANYVLDSDGQPQELKVPSGMQSGYKLVGTFTVAAGQETEVLLDFDAAKSVIRAGNSGRWLLKPTVKMAERRNLATVSGTVTTDETGALEGATVSAQHESPEAEDPKNEVKVESATISAENGAYSLFLEPGTSNLVVYKEGYDPACARRTAAATDSLSQDFILAPAESLGTVAGTVAIEGGGAEESVLLSFRQTLSCGEESHLVEVTSTSVVNGETYNVELPLGVYTLVAVAEEAPAQEQPIEVTAADLVLDLIL